MTASVVIACHTEERWSLILKAINSALAQSPSATEIIVVVDHNLALRNRLEREVKGITVLENVQARGASGARNTGASYASSEFVAFLDDDAAAEPDWLSKLVRAFADPSVVGTGGRVLPAWHQKRPGWFPEEFDWVIGASHVGMPTTVAPVRNVWAENMAVRRDVFATVGGFRTGFGKLGSHSRPEDTDLCIRMAGAVPGGQWMYDYDAVVRHFVPPGRSRYRFFLSRTYHEGRGKAELARLLPVPSQALSSERDYVRKVLPRGVRRHATEAVRTGRPTQLLRSCNIVVGLASTTWGFAWQKAVDGRSAMPAQIADARTPVDSGRAA